MANVALAALVAVLWLNQTETPKLQTQPANAETVTIQLRPGESAAAQPPAPVFAVRVTAEDLVALVNAEPLSPQFELESQRQAAVAALKQIAMAPLLDALGDVLTNEFADRFDPAKELITVPVPEAARVRIDTPDLTPNVYHGPEHEIVGFILHRVSKGEFKTLAVRVIQTARQLLDSGEPTFNRTAPDYYQRMAEREIDKLRDRLRRRAEDARKRNEIKAHVAEALGLERDGNGAYTGEVEWLKESRRFSYIVKEGKFIQRLEPLVRHINEEMEIAGFAPPSALDRPGIYYDAEIGDVEIVLPKQMLDDFLEQADAFERRMAEDAIISIEAVRITDRDIISGALASRLNAQIQGVHDSKSGFKKTSILRELGLNAILAVANQDLQVRALEGIAAGTVPEGIQPVQIAPPTLPPVVFQRTATTIGSTSSIGADPIFFDGREQVYGFSYTSPDGIDHRLSLEVVDSLRETWERIERNLIVHKIKKTDSLTSFSVPVGPETKTYNGIAALISQENQQLIVATGTGAISEISATAGTWLVIEGFEITPIPGSSTTLTEEEQRAIESKVLLTMFLRDPRTEAGFKRKLLKADTTAELRSLLRTRAEEYENRPIHSGREPRSYGTVFDERYAQVLADERFEKKERNSVITLTFYSSQGNIVQTPGTTQLGDANDLTSFTTELRPNVVTPISSFFTKGGSGTTGTSPLTGVPKGEQTDQSKTMTHLVVRARFPTIGREDADREEGRFTGYFELPIQREPASSVDLPFLSSSEHPAERLAKLRFGLMFPVLDRQRVRKPFARFNPQRFPGDVSRDAWETATTRMLMVRKIIGDSPGASAALASDFVMRFIVEVRSLLEYDKDFFDAPSFALRNMTHWNDPDRIRLALNQSPGRFALERLVGLLDELGEQLVPNEYADDFLAVSPPSGLRARRIYPVSDDQLRLLRRDVAAHYLRFKEVYGDAFLEAVSKILKLGTYATTEERTLEAGPFRGYLDLVVFNQGADTLSNPARYEAAHQAFLFLKKGGHKGKLFERSMLSLEHLPDDQRTAVYRDRDILAVADSNGTAKGARRW